MNWKLFLTCFLAYYSNAQTELTYRNYSQELGLVSSTIYDIVQDNEGYIYVGHDKGCSRFNGLSFIQPKYVEDPNALSNFMVFSNNQIVCRNFQGKCFKLKNGELSPIDIPIKSSWSFPTFMDDLDDHYVFRDNQIALIDENGKGKIIQLKLPLINRIYHGVVKDQVAYLFVSFLDNTELLAYDLKDKKIIAARKFPDKCSVRLFKSNNEVYWLNELTGEIGDVKQGFKTDATLFDKTLGKGTKFTDFVVLKDGRKLIGTFNGLYVLDANWKLESHFLKGIQCSKILVDSDNALWVGSLQNGLFYVPSIDYFQLNSAEVTGKNVKFSKFCTDGNLLYAGTYDGRIFILNEKGEIVQTIDFQREAEIQSIYVKDKILYAYCSGLIKVDIQSGKKLNEWKWHATKSIYVNDTYLYFGTSRGLGVLDKDNLESFFGDQWIKQVLPLGDKRLLVESTEEIFSFNPITKQKKVIQKKGNNINFLSEKWFFKTDYSVYVLFSNGKKKSVFQSKIKINRLFTQNNQLLLELVGGKWITISSETYAIQPITNKFLLKEILYMSEVGDYFVQANNTTIRYIKKGIDAPHSYLKLKEVEKKGHARLNDDKLVLSSDDNDLSISLDLLPNYQFMGTGEVYYRIVGLDAEWRKALMGDKYMVELLRIPPGEYTLEIYGTNGVDKTEVMRYPIRVNQPYYFQWWFILIVLLVVATIVYLLLRWRARLFLAKNNRKLKEQELKMSALNSELTAIRSQMNPHFIFNSLSSIQTKILNEDRVEAYKSLNTFSTLLRQALQHTSKEFLSLTDEISFTRNYIQLEQTRTSKAFEYKEEIDPTLNTDILRIPSLFLQPFVENAIRHGLMHSKNKKCLLIRMTAMENGFFVIIEDNGIGRAESNRINLVQRPEHESFATSAIQDRIAILNETKKMHIDIKIIDLDKGTRVEINFWKHEGR